MLLFRRLVNPVLRCYSLYTNAGGIINSYTPKILSFPYQKRTFSSLLQNERNSLLSNPKVIEISRNIPRRTVTKFSWKKGKRKTVKTVLMRFYRLNWGGWIRTKCGRNKRLWRKSPPRKRRLRQHVLCNAQQSYLLDKMVNKYWRKPKYYVDDPYEPYHTREECYFAAKKPKPYIPPEEIQ